MMAKQRVPALRGRASRRFGCERVGCESNFVAARLPETENSTQHTGNLGNVGAPRREFGALSPRRGPTLAAIVLCHAVKRHPSRRTQTGGSHEIVTSSPRCCG